MKVVRLRSPAGLGTLELVEADPPKPRAGEVQVRIRASSVNFHDDLVVHGKIPSADGRVPMTDANGKVTSYAMKAVVSSSLSRVWT